MCSRDEREIERETSAANKEERDSLGDSKRKRKTLSGTIELSSSGSTHRATTESLGLWQPVLISLLQSRILADNEVLGWHGNDADDDDAAAAA